MPSARYVPQVRVPDIYESPNLVRLAELARASGYSQADRARAQGATSALGWARLGDLVVNALNGISGDKQAKAALAQRASEKAADDKLARDKFAEEVKAREAQQQWQRDQFRVATADAAADVMTPGQSVTPEQFTQRFAGTPSEARFAHDPARAGVLPATAMADTGGVPGYSVRPEDVEQQPWEPMAAPSMSPDTAARPEQYTRRPLFTESMAMENLQRQKEAAAAAAANTVADNARADATARNLAKYQAAQLKLRQRQVDATEAKAKATESALALSPDAIEEAAHRVRLYGPGSIPTRFNEGDKKAILNRSAAINKAIGQSPAAAAMRSALQKADQGALNQITKQASSAEAFENKALQQSELVKELSGKVNRTAYPNLNKWIVDGKVALGDTPAHLLGNALLTYTSEYAKIMEGSTGSAAGSSDAARRSAAELISKALSKGTLAATIDQMNREMGMTRTGYRTTIDDITGRMGGTPQQPPPYLSSDPNFGTPVKPKGGG